MWKLFRRHAPCVFKHVVEIEYETRRRVVDHERMPFGRIDEHVVNVHSAQYRVYLFYALFRGFLGRRFQYCPEIALLLDVDGRDQFYAQTGQRDVTIRDVYRKSAADVPQHVTHSRN